MSKNRRIASRNVELDKKIESVSNAELPREFFDDETWLKFKRLTIPQEKKQKPIFNSKGKLPAEFLR